MKLNELVTTKDKENLLKFFSVLQKELFAEGDYEMYWNTARMYQSLSSQVVKKRVFVDHIGQYNVVLYSFIKQENHVYFNYEIWINKNIISESYYNDFMNYIMHLFRDLLVSKTYVLLRSIPNYIVNDIKKCLHIFSLREGFNKPVTGFLKSELINTDRLPLLKENFEIKQIDETKSVEILSEWMYGHESDADWISVSLASGCDLGVFDKKNGELIGHFILMSTGTFGALSIKSNYKGMGIGKRLAVEQTNHVLNRNMLMLIEIEPDNVVSKRLFNQLQFRPCCEMTYIALDNANDNVINSRYDL